MDDQLPDSARLCARSPQPHFPKGHQKAISDIIQIWSIHRCSFLPSFSREQRLAFIAAVIKNALLSLRCEEGEKKSKQSIPTESCPEGDYHYPSTWVPCFGTNWVLKSQSRPMWITFRNLQVCLTEAWWSDGFPGRILLDHPVQQRETTIWPSGKTLPSLFFVAAENDGRSNVL